MIWRPDTCECVLEFNGSNAPKNLVRVVSRGPEHSLVADDAALASIVVEENQRKNYAIYDELLKLFPELRTSVGGEGFVYRDGFEPSWNFDALRVLHVQTISLNTTKKVTAQTALNTRFGAGLIVVE